jgi:asparagine synthase (glutamine-hydrolysing)
VEPGSDVALAGGLGSYGPLAAKLTTGTPPATVKDAYLRLVLRGPDGEGAINALVSQLFATTPDLGQALTLTDLAVSWRTLMLTSDALSSRLGLERRSPYLAKELIEFAYAMPLNHKLPTPGRGK